MTSKLSLTITKSILKTWNRNCVHIHISYFVTHHTYSVTIFPDDLPHRWAGRVWVWFWRWAGRWRWPRVAPVCCSWRGGRRRAAWRPGCRHLLYAPESRVSAAAAAVTTGAAAATGPGAGRALQAWLRGPRRHCTDGVRRQPRRPRRPPPAQRDDVAGATVGQGWAEKAENCAAESTSRWADLTW